MARSRLAGVLIAVVSVLLLLSLIEAGLRILSPGAGSPAETENSEPLDLRAHVLVHRRSEIPGLFYELNPGTFTVTKGVVNEINSFGMRDREISMDKPEGVYRIAVLGDSFTYGWGVTLEDTYVKKLESMLNRIAAGGVHFEVLDFGVSGYNTEQEVIALEQKVSRFDPDLVIIGFVANDILFPVSPLARYLLRQDPSFVKIAREAARLRLAYTPRSAAEMLPRWLSWSRLADMICQRIENTRKGDFLMNYYHNPERLQRLQHAFLEASRFLGEAGISSLVVMFPADLNILHEHPRREIQERVGAMLHELGFPTIDLLDIYLDEPAGKIALDAQDPHPSPYGHEVAARAICDFLVENDMVPVSSR